MQKYRVGSFIIDSVRIVWHCLRHFWRLLSYLEVEGVSESHRFDSRLDMGRPTCEFLIIRLNCNRFIVVRVFANMFCREIPHKPF